ncbi:outer membrane beta-barrel protein [Algoriphagus sp. D3-2-R+10]|uniref:outer membrane beta-barrel protein n=1 Tax=Algoriphagus aurantiacus TaxID=3103948 RepID=UPI002B3B6609|nr:outer membrane beta-barrel protein [Algoriphagus sp. D3-2-R+10]MEB2776972.1 outer membrane beta-barrel protein [Algoriphagus sp. D3-2-R+10]
MVKILRWAAVFLLMCMPFFYAQAQGGYIEEAVWSNINPASGLVSDFIILSDGTKLFGEIIRNYDYTEYEKVDFEFNGGINTYLPADLKAFGLVNGRFFMSKKLSESSELEFVQVLLSGRLQLDYKKGNYYLDNGIEIQQLRSFYQDTQGPGSSRRRHIKLYISTLKINTAGTCGMELTDLIERSRIDEQDFIRILTQYHECEDLPYKLHVEKIPFVKISPTVGVGIGTLLTRSYNNEQGRASRIDKPYFFQAQAGIRFHDFRKSPKISIDVRIGYNSVSGIWEISETNSAILVTASQQFKQNVVSIPLSFNYSILKKNEMDVYLGLKAGLMFNSLKTEEGTVDFTFIHNRETFLSHMPILDVEKTLFVQGLKIGSNWSFAKKRTFYTEIQADYTSNTYLTYLPNSTNVGYNALYVSLNMGIEF